MLFLGFIGACVWQTSVMRAAAAEDEKVVRRTYTWGAVGFLIRFLIPYFWGICGLIFVWQSPQLRGIFLPEGGQADSSLQLRAMPIALSRLMPAGLIGMLTAGMLAAAMSTYNTYLHTWSAVLTQDVANPLFGGRLSSRTRILCARIIMCVIALFLLIWGLWYPLGERLWDYMAITGAIYFTGAFAVLLGGIYWTAASRVGAYGAFLCGFVMIVGLSPVQHWLRVEWAGPNLGVLTAALAWSTLVILSILFPDVPHTAGACDAAERPKRPVGVSIVGALVVAGYLLGLGASVYAPAELIGGLGLLYPAWAPWPFFRPEGEVWGAAMPYLCLLGIGAGVGLLTGRPWARWLWLGLTLAALPWVAGAALTNMWRAGELALYGTALAALFGRPATMHFLWKPAPGGTAAGSE
jgi:Na+/proline symporter